MANILPNPVKQGPRASVLGVLVLLMTGLLAAGACARAASHAATSKATMSQDAAAWFVSTAARNADGNSVATSFVGTVAGVEAAGRIRADSGADVGLLTDHATFRLRDGTVHVVLPPGVPVVFRVGGATLKARGARFDLSWDATRYEVRVTMTEGKASVSVPWSNFGYSLDASGDGGVSGLSLYGGPSRIVPGLPVSTGKLSTPYDCTPQVLGYRETTKDGQCSQIVAPPAARCRTHISAAIGSRWDICLERACRRRLHGDPDGAMLDHIEAYKAYGQGERIDLSLAVETMLFLGEHAVRAGSHQQALQYFEEAAAVGPVNTLYHEILAKASGAALQVGDAAKAKHYAAEYLLEDDTGGSAADTARAVVDGGHL